MDSKHRIRFLGNPECFTGDLFFCCFYCVRSIIGVCCPSFVFGFRRNMGSVPHGCNSRSYCVRGFCGSVARNPRDKGSRYGKENINPESQILPKRSATLRKERHGVKLMHKTRWHPKKKKKNGRESTETSWGVSGAMFSTPLPIRSEWNKDRLINSRVDVDVAKSSQTPTKVNAVPQSEKREGEKGRRDGGGEKIWGSNASLMRLLVVSAVGAWHRHSAVSQPTKICSACRISAALFCLRPNTHA